jgi:hypothetical protein
MPLSTFTALVQQLFFSPHPLLLDSCSDDIAFTQRQASARGIVVFCPLTLPTLQPESVGSQRCGYVIRSRDLSWAIKLSISRLITEYSYALEAFYSTC